MAFSIVEEAIDKIEALAKVLRHEADQKYPMTTMEMNKLREAIRDEIQHQKGLEKEHDKEHKKEPKHRL
jgi:RNase adaptor protein for sRNA GlmZ degradation